MRYYWTYHSNLLPGLVLLRANGDTAQNSFGLVVLAIAYQPPGAVRECCQSMLCTRGTGRSTHLSGMKYAATSRNGGHSHCKAKGIL